MSGRKRCKRSRGHLIPIDHNKISILDINIAPFLSPLRSRVDAIQHGFHLKFPDEYLWFYAFCCSVNPDDPLRAFEQVTDLHLVGPFELLHSELAFPIEPGKFALCYRYFHDPPEFVTLLKGPDYCHIGCWRDSPEELPSAIVFSNAAENGHMDLIAPNLFSALKVLLDRKLVAGQELLNKLEIFARKHQIPITVSESAIRARLHTCVCPTLNGIGLRINLRESGLGYRPLSVSNSKLSSILQHVVGADTDENRLSKLEAVDELVTFAQFACDEGDFGQSLELGLSMLAFHPKGRTLFNSYFQHDDTDSEKKFSAFISTEILIERDVCDLISGIYSYSGKL
ncbi:unnamed protein product [Dicrocoelium dendriticum]|nr:unnamed protein product [Dicrocoelium dendriticum]